MADNFLERQRRDYEERKRKWQNAKTGGKAPSVATIFRRSREEFSDD